MPKAPPARSTGRRATQIRFDPDVDDELRARRGKRYISDIVNEAVREFFRRNPKPPKPAA